MKTNLSKIMYCLLVIMFPFQVQYSQQYNNILVVGPFQTSNVDYFYIDTKIPFSDAHAPQIHVTGYNYGNPNKAIKLTLGWYSYASDFYWTQYKSDLGYYNPSSIRLGTYNDAGTVRVRIEIANNNVYWSSFFFSATNFSWDALTYTGWTYHEGRMPASTGNVTIVAEYSGITYDHNGNLGIGTNNTGGDKLRVSTGDQFFRVLSEGIGVTDKDWTNTLLMSNYGNRAEIYHNDGRPLVLQYQGQGSVGIGTANPTAKLTVAGDIRAREIKVEANAGADFVFDEEYRLRSLPEIEQFIIENKHLPDIAPANEMAENGIDMGEMQIKLLQKVEELTLYVIEQQKQIEALKQQITEKQASRF